MTSKTRFLTKEEFNLIAEARAKGATLRDIVRLVGRSYATVQRATKASSYRSYTYRRKHRRRSSRNQAQTAKSRPVVTLKNITEPDIKAEKKEEHLNYGDVVFVSTPRGAKLGTVVAFNEDKSECIVQIASRFRTRYVDIYTHKAFKVDERCIKEDK